MLRRELLFENREYEVIRRNYRDRINFTGLQDSNFKECFRVNHHQFEFILNKVGSKLQHKTRRSSALSAQTQLLLSLHWLGNGCQYHGIASMHGVSKSTVCRIIHRVVNTIVSTLFHSIVRWPDNVETIAAKFFEMGGFPCVCGCVDGTLINIDAPTSHEEVFVNRHGNHSLNVMMICGPDYKFYAVNANWPGSVHDSRVLRNSAICHKFDHGWRPFADAIVLGDSGYGLKKWLIPPLRRNPNNPAEETFNRCHKKTRRIIENSFGILKERFPCLNHMRLAPTFAGKVVLVCVILHNISCSNAENIMYNIISGEDIHNEVEYVETEIEFDHESGIQRITSLLKYFN